jgi:microcystin-dependent protein
VPIKTYSTTAGNNTASPPNGAPIGTTKVSQLDDIQRQVMADVREWYETPEWRDLGNTPVFVSGTSFQIGSNVTASYRVGQRIRITDSSTIYGTIASATFSSPNTTIAVTLDSGSITASITAVALGLNPDNDPIPAAGIGGVLAEANIPTSALIPAGIVSPFAGSAAPSGWLLCAGQAVNRTTYATLFTAISTTYGVGDGSTTFNLPDLRGRAVFGEDDMGGSAANRVTAGVSGITGTTLGAAGGSEAMHQHNHGITDAGHVHSTAFNWATTGGGGTAAQATTSGLNPQNGVNSATTGITINNAGTGTSQNMPPAIILNYIIKT